MQRLAGAATFPAQITAPVAVGAEVPREGVAAIRAIFEKLLPGATVAPLQLRGRAIGDTARRRDQQRPAARSRLRSRDRTRARAPIQRPHRHRAPDPADQPRRRDPTEPAAARIARVGGASLAGNVLPGYEIGGDWFDYTENPRGTWIGIADSDGNGAAAAGIGAVTLGAFRSAQIDPAESLLAMHKVLFEIGNGAPTSTATIGHWNAPASTFRWVTAGDEPPFRITAEGQLKPLEGDLQPPLGSHEFPDRLHTNETRLDKTERVLLLSDSFTDPERGLGLPAIARAVSKADNHAAAATLRAIEDRLRATNPDQLDDDATIVVLAPSGMIGAS